MKLLIRGDRIVGTATDAYKGPDLYMVAPQDIKLEELRYRIVNDVLIYPAADIVRTQRNQKLVASDWTQGRDIPESVSSVWAAYRQALRDITTQAGFPDQVVWPEQPQ